MLIKNQGLFTALLFLFFSMDLSHFKPLITKLWKRNEGNYQVYDMRDKVLNDLKKVEEQFEKEFKILI